MALPRRSMLFRSLASTALAGALLFGSSAAQADREAPGAGSTAWQLGTFTKTTGTVGDCPTGSDCFPFVVKDCPQVQDRATGAVSTEFPDGVPPRGVVLFFRGGVAADWWAFTDTSQEWLERIRQRDGFVTVQVKFDLGWLSAHSGVPSGSALLACRTSTAVKWVYDNIYVPLGLHPARGACGYCITGNSSGASAVAYALAYYGLDTILNAVIPTGGPDHTAITKACLQDSVYGYNDIHRQTVDLSYGFLDATVNPGPCYLSDPSWSATWDADSLELGGNDYDHPDTRVEFIEGGLDDTGAVPHGRLYLDTLRLHPLTRSTWTFLPNMEHRIADSRNGLQTLERALLKTLG